MVTKDNFIPTGVLKRVRRAVYAGSFDPLTYGHMWMIERGLDLFDELIVAIGDNPKKTYTFTVDERIKMLQDSIEWPQNARIRQDDRIVDIACCKGEVTHFLNKFLIDYAVQQDCQYILRGLRNIADYEYEREMAAFNGNMHTGHVGVTTIWLPTPVELAGLSSSFVKSLCGPENWQRRVKDMVPPPVFEKLLAWQAKK